MVMTTENFDEEYFNEWREHTRKNDVYYFLHQEEYPEDYSPMTRTYELFIIRALSAGKITEEDLICAVYESSGL